MARNPGFVVEIEGGGKGLLYHKEQTPEFKALKKHFIHFITDDYHPIIENGKEKTGLKDDAKLKIIGYLD